ncbi:hypothetical protein MPL1_04627 [Methylophaga lonarensis MPL]|uniref:Uncharacterized protein n=1 Tax=Methylophaga lonarensis MPL TaxID=1286106 RepID=M7PSR6_9GAMM|nr:hypothetical protein [Methylophaga lonarensis]EMR13499.1 hypothetical protein MPL1_04627 [Methylophaga lonarensis MPL]
MKLPHKGFLLQQLSQVPSYWDYQLIPLALTEYQVQGLYWINHFSIALDELAAAGLINRISERIDDGTAIASGRLLFEYSLSRFGRQRMHDTGLLPEGVE